jgi:hypothetical protein
MKFKIGDAVWTGFGEAATVVEVSADGRAYGLALVSDPDYRIGSDAALVSVRKVTEAEAIKAYSRGWHAALRYSEPQLNPYPDLSDAWHAWHAGFADSRERDALLTRVQAV